MIGYKTVHVSGTGEIVEKKSRFIANVFHVETENEALEIIEATRKKYWDAKHNCYAYTIGVTNPTEKCSDDGEPVRTAGRPILDVIKGDSLCNTLIVVTRYFGGTLLGTGGLVRAYSGSARAGIDNSVILERLPGTKTRVTTDYNGIGKLQYIASSNDIPILDTQYTDKVECTVLCNNITLGLLKKQMSEATSGGARIEQLGEVLYSTYEDKILLFDY